MSLVTPHAWTAGDNATSTFMQTLTDAISQLQGNTPTAGALDFAVLYQTATQTLTTSTWTAVTFDSETGGIDSASGHSTATNTSRYTAVHTGWYQVCAGASFAVNATGSRGIRFAVNGTALSGRTLVPATPATVSTDIPLSRKVRLNAGDYLEVQVWQNSGGNLATAYVAGNEGCYLDIDWRHT